MQVVKRALRGLAIVIFALCLPLFVATAAWSLTFGRPDTLKQSLDDAEVYDRFVDSALTSLDQSGEDQAQDGQDNLVPDNQIIRAAVEQAFPPRLLQSSAESIIDGFYGWLAGKVERPDFHVDLSSAKQTLAQSIADQSVARLQGLPECTAEQLAQIDVNDFDPLGIPCRPPGLDLNALRAEYFNEVANSQDLLPDPVITADTFTSDENNRQDQFHDNRAPEVFQWSRRLPWILGAVILLTALAAILLHADHRRSIRTLSKTLLIIGLIGLIGSLLAVLVFGNISPGGEAGPTEVPELAFGLLFKLLTALSRTAATISAFFVILGATGLLWLHFSKKPKATNTSDEKNAR